MQFGAKRSVLVDRRSSRPGGGPPSMPTGRIDRLSRFRFLELIVVIIVTGVVIIVVVIRIIVVRVVVVRVVVRVENWCQNRNRHPVRVWRKTRSGRWLGVRRT